MHFYNSAVVIVNRNDILIFSINIGQTLADIGQTDMLATLRQSFRALWAKYQERDSTLL